ncbi:MAG: hypothetical protein GY854_20020 [Deltaproteobacteria bacterium]|nr:hypothetical protein [Deltaproteobacteria bacterium]
MPFKRTVWIGVALIATLIAASPLRADELTRAPDPVVIHATLSEDGDVIDGTVELRITNDTGVSIGAIPLWLYPNRFRESGPNLDDRMIRWIYPSGESEGGIDIARPAWNGSSLSSGSIVLGHIPPPGNQHTKGKVIARVRLPAPLEPGATGTLRLDFRVEIPKRRGRFGRWKGVVSLGGGWFPRPLTDLTGQDTTIPPEPILADVRVELPARRGAVLHNQVFEWSEKKRAVEAGGLETDSLVLVVMDMMEIDTQTYEWGEAIHVHRDLRNKKPTWKDTRGGEDDLAPGLKDLGETDISGRLFDVVGNTAQIVRKYAPGASVCERIVLVEIPAWDRLVQPGSGPVLVSNRIWRMVRVEQAMWFHDLAVARVVGAQLVWPVLHRIEGPLHRHITADVVGSRIAGSYSRDVHQASKTVAEMIGFASFIPTVDNLLYAPQVPFREVYSQSVEEPDYLRDEPWRFMNQLPRGKRILGKLEDLVGVDAAEQLVVRMLGENAAFEEVIAGSLGEDHQWFFDQWYGVYPQVNYRLGKIEDIPLGDGKIMHRVEVVREGEVIREPVTVRITDKDKIYEDVSWEGDGQRGVLEWISKAPVDQVQVDPKARLVEAAELTANHPLADNYEHLPWRLPMLTRFLIWGEVTSGDPYVQVGFSLRRRYDVTNSIAFGGLYTPRSYGGTVGYYRYFGPKRTLNARTWFLGPSLGVTRYRAVTEADPHLPEDTRFAATAGSIGFVVGRDNRSYFYDPRDGLAFYVRGGYSAGADDEGRAVQMGRLSSNFVGIASPAIRHVFALSIGAMGLVGNPTAAQLATLSMRQILRGFDVDETYGRVGMYVVGEYRHTLFDASHVPVPPMGWFDRFQGVLFVGGGTISKPSGYTGLFEESRLYSEVGYGLRIHTLAFGVQQYVIALDFAWALTPLNRQMPIEQSDGSIVYQIREPFKIVFGIMQTF